MSTMAARASSNLSGFLLRIVQKKKNVHVRHKLDTDIDKYYKTLHNIVIPQCVELIKDTPIMSQRVKECIAYTTPSYYDGWNFCTELVYRIVADEHHQTEENIEKARMLRVLVDVAFSMSCILDDYVDKGELRQGKKTWASVCEGGQEAAVYDTYTVNYLITCLLKRHFRNHPGYSRMLELLPFFHGSAAIGNTLDFLDRSCTNYNDYMWKYIIHHKAMGAFSFGSGVGLVYAGILSDDLIYKTMSIFGYYGLLFQVWDDVMEYYFGEEVTGKGAVDSKYNIKSWISVTAMAHFNDAQTKEFRACYGSSDPDKKARLCTLLDEVDIIGKYVDYMKNIRISIEKKINNIPDARIRYACTSYLEWLLGEEPHDAQLEGLKASNMAETAKIVNR